MPSFSKQKIRAAFPPFNLAAVLLCLMAAGWTAPSQAASAAAAPKAAAGGRAAKADSISALAAVLKNFDSLMDAGAYDKARALCVGGALRMFPFLALTQSKLAGLVDTARSTDSNLEEKISGDWAYLKVKSRVVFTRPFMGQSEMTSLQAVHLWRARRGWRIAEFEELEDARAPVTMRSGAPAEDSTPAGSGAAHALGAQAAAPIPADLFPISPRAPDPPLAADSLRYRLRLRHGGALATLCPTGPSQTRIREVTPSDWILVNHRPALPPARRPAGRLPDSLAPYLGSNPFLDLGDSLLLATAKSIVAPGAAPVDAAGAIYAWVSDRFRFSLGAVLFGTSREVLRGMTGDCSEAAVLTAALLRASGVPARVVLGFASVGRGVFIGHAWAEAWLGGWVGVDAALGQYPAGVERIQLAALDGRADMRIAATNVMLSALSNLDVDIQAAWKNGKPIPLKRIDGNAQDGVKFFQQILDGMGTKK